MARELLDGTQKAAAKAAALPAGGGGAAAAAPACGAGDVANPSAFAIDPKWLQDAEYMGFGQLLNQKQ